MKHNAKIEWAAGAIGFCAGAYFFLFFLLFVFTCGACARHSIGPAPLERSTQVEQERAAVKVETFCLAEDPWSGTSFRFGTPRGSGVIINDRQVLTANHVIDCPYAVVIRVVTQDGRTFRVHVEKTWEKLDVARLELDKPDETFGVKPADWGAPPSSGEPVCAATLFPTPGYNCGAMIADSDDDEDDVKWAGMVWRGNSGSGLYDKHGRLVGIVTMGFFLGDMPLGRAGGSSMRAEYLK